MREYLSCLIASRIFSVPLLPSSFLIRSPTIWLFPWLHDLNDSCNRLSRVLFQGYRRFLRDRRLFLDQHARPTSRSLKRLGTYHQLNIGVCPQTDYYPKFGTHPAGTPPILVERVKGRQGVKVYEGAKADRVLNLGEWELVLRCYAKVMAKVI